MMLVEEMNKRIRMKADLDRLAGKEFIASARQVCGAIENFSIDNTGSILSSLIQLLNCADKLVHSAVPFKDEDWNGEVVWPEALKSIPEDVVFQVVFDPLDATSLCASSLRESLGEIYQELKSGLNALDKYGHSEDAVLWNWKLMYETHWGRHVLDVIRFLFLSM